MSVLEERRCPSCRALVSADAEWCGQCFSSLSPHAESGLDAGSVRPTTSGGREGGRGQMRASPGWTCPACEHLNPLDLDACEVCNTAFAALFRRDEERPTVDPRTALARSLILPGLGHRAIGRGADGLARGILFAWTFGTTILVAVSGASSGPMVALLAVYGLLALMIYVLTAMEAYVMARGGTPIVSSRVLLWGAVSLVLVSVLMATFIIFAAARS